MADSKKTSFADIQKKFFDADATDNASKETATTSITDDSSNSELKIDASHFDFDVNNPEAILIAGCSSADSCTPLPAPKPAPVDSPSCTVDGASASST